MLNCIIPYHIVVKLDYTYFSILYFTLFFRYNLLISWHNGFFHKFFILRENVLVSFPFFHFFPFFLFSRCFLQISLSFTLSDNEHFFVYALRLKGEDYKKMKNEQRLLVEIEDLPGFIKDFLEEVKKGKGVFKGTSSDGETKFRFFSLWYNCLIFIKKLLIYYHKSWLFIWSHLAAELLIYSIGKN